jgi:glucose-1-phosphate cytidylyltransferase
MKVVLFCGGMGTRLREYSPTVPKPLVPIGDRPIIWHLMRYYAHFGHDEFILCLGHGAELIREYFCTEDPGWRVTFVDTGLDASIGERLRSVAPLVAGDEMFLANYSDGLSDLDLDQYVEEFRCSRAIGSLLCVKPSQTFHPVHVRHDGVVDDIRPARDADVWINGGFFAFRPELFDYLHEHEDLVEEPFARLIERHRLRAHRHHGFWAAMDTMQDKVAFDEIEASGRAPWKVWDLVTTPDA